METILDIGRAVFPLLVTASIVVFVIKRLEHKNKQGTLGKKETASAQTLLDSLIPLGMLAGVFVSIIISLFFDIQMFSIMAYGAGAGFLFGYIAYEWYSDQPEEDTN